MTEEPEETISAKVACMGLRLSGSGILCYAWVYLDDKNEPKDEEDYLLFEKKRGNFPLTNKPNVGDIYPITKKGSLTSVAGMLEWMDHNHPKLKDWKLESRAAEARHIATSQASKLEIGGMTLDEIKKKMENTIGRAKRTALLMSVVEFIS